MRVRCAVKFGYKKALLLRGSFLLCFPDVGLVSIALPQGRQQADIQIQALAP